MVSEAGLPSTAGPQPNDLCHAIAYTYLSRAINDIHCEVVIAQIFSQHWGVAYGCVIRQSMYVVSDFEVGDIR